VDKVLAFPNDGRLHDYITSYDEFTNRMTLEPHGRLLSHDVGDRSTLSDYFHFALTGGRVEGITRTSCALVHNNLITQNHATRARAASAISLRKFRLARNSTR
jgi:hypothetical protein